MRPHVRQRGIPQTHVELVVSREKNGFFERRLGRIRWHQRQKSAAVVGVREDERLDSRKVGRGRQVPQIRIVECLQVEKPRKSGRRQFRENIVAEIPKKQQNDCLKACTRYISYLKQKKSPNGYYEGPITLSELVHRIPEFQEIQEFQGFLTGFQRFRIFEDLKDLKYSNGFRPDFNDFRLGVRDFSDLKLGFQARDFWSGFTVYRNFRYCRDFRLDFRDFRPDFKTFVLRISEVVGPSGYHFHVGHWNRVVYGCRVKRDDRSLE